MTIHRSTDFVDVYRAKAKAKDINELSGRTGRPDLTDFVSTEILRKLHLTPDTILVDVGCGDGRLLHLAAASCVDGFRGRLIGILPSFEEVMRVQNFLKKYFPNKLISIQLGTASQTHLPDNYADSVVCNSVILLLQDEEKVEKAIAELSRISKLNGTIYIGEQPSIDEMNGKNYGDSIVSWLFWTLNNRGIKEFFSRLRQVLVAAISNEPFIVAPKNIYYASPERFISILQKYNLRVDNFGRHRIIDQQGLIADCASRYSYICTKTQV